MKRSLRRYLISLLLVFTLAIPSGFVFAQDTTPPAGYREYTVQAGDSFARLANRYLTTIDKLLEVNHLSATTVLQIGQVIWVPDVAASAGTVNVPGRPAGLPNGSVILTGSGATFPAPLYQSWIFTYKNVDPVAAINYQPTGSGAGKKAIIDGVVDFAGSDSLVTAAEYSAGGDLQMFPIVAGAVVPAYNVTGTDGKPVPTLTFSRTALADIFLGKITKWNDAALVSLNPNAKLPNKTITTIHRSDGSGTTEIFTKALKSFSADWASKVGAGSSVQWPVGIGASGNAGVAAAIKNTPNSIGYTESAYAIANKLTYGFMVNKSKVVVKADSASLKSAMSDFSGSFSAQLTTDIVDAPGANSWPIAGYTYIVLHMNKMTDCNKAATLLTFMQWALTNPVAAGTASTLGYATLPGEVSAQTLARLHKVTCNGQVVLP